MATAKTELVVLAVFNVLEILFFGGLEYGWVSLVYVLQTDGVYRYLCIQHTNYTDIATNTTITEEEECYPQSERFNLLFSIGITAFLIGSVVPGQLYFKYDVVKVRILTIFVMVVGVMCFGFTSPEIPWLFLPGIVFVGMAGVSMLISAMQVSTLLPKRGSTIYIGIANGSFDFSVVTQRLVKLLAGILIRPIMRRAQDTALHGNGVSRVYSFAGVALLCVVISGLCTFFHYTVEQRIVRKRGDGIKDETAAQRKVTKNGTAEQRQVTKDGTAEQCKVTKDGTAEQRKVTKDGTAEQCKVTKDGTAEQRKVTKDGTAEQRKVTKDGTAEQRKVTKDGTAEQRKVTKDGTAEQRNLTKDGTAEQIKITKADNKVTMDENKSEGDDVEACPVSEDVSLGQLVCSRIFLFHVLWMSIMFLRFFYYLGAANHLLEDKLGKADREDVSYFTDVMAYTMLGGLVSSFIAGKILLVGRVKTVVPVTVTSCLAIILSSLAFVQSRSGLYADFVVLTFFRSFIFCVNMGFIVLTFPRKYISLLYGLCMAIPGILSLTQYALFTWTERYDNALTHVNIFLLCLSVLSLAHPALTLLHHRRHRQVPP